MVVYNNRKAILSGKLFALGGLVLTVVLQRLYFNGCTTTSEDLKTD